MNPIAQLYQHLDAKDLWREKLSLKRNEYLKVAGSTDTHLYYIEEGALRVFMLDEYQEHSIRFGYKGNFIAALDSYISEKPSNLYIQALKAKRVTKISKEAFQDFVKNDPDIFELWLSILEQLVYQQLEREQDILTSSPLERYQRVLRRSPQLFQEVPHKYIASYLRMTPETLSRLRKS